MCYISTHMSRTVGIRELRQNLSQYTARTALGESFAVTDRGRVVGRLVPPSTGEAWLDVLVAQGVVQPAQRRSRVFPRPAPGGGASISEALAAERAERLR
jgi:antitoxin (DNA-binding transcriptional repressor) of toxin-antitoxin stability system